jgi:hypothetical protein
MPFLLATPIVRRKADDYTNRLLTPFGISIARMGFWSRSEKAKE